MRCNFDSIRRRTHILTRNDIPAFDTSMGPQRVGMNKIIEFRFQSANRHKLNEGVNNKQKIVVVVIVSSMAFPFWIIFSISIIVTIHTVLSIKAIIVIRIAEGAISWLLFLRYRFIFGFLFLSTRF